MATQLTFDDHDRFHHEVLRGTVGAAAGGAAVGLLAALSNNPTYELQRWAPVVLVAMGAGLGFVGERLGQRLTRAVLIGLAALVPAMVLLYLRFSYPTFSWVLSGLGLGLAITLFEGNGIRRGLGALLGVPALMVAGFAGLRFGLFGLAEGLAPVPVVAAVAGAVGGFIATALTGVRRVTVLTDPVARAFRKAEDKLRGELLRHATQAKRVYDQILDDLKRRKIEKALEHDLRDRAKELCLSLFETALRWQAIQGETAGKNEAEIRSRVDDLQRSATQAKDPIAREQYERAANSLMAQLTYLQSIGRGRERTVARIVSQLALLEKVRFSLMNYHATDSERLADELRDVARELEDLTSDVDIIGQALRESQALPPATVKQTIPEPVEVVAKSESETSSGGAAEQRAEASVEQLEDVTAERS
ncbi:MAG: hypothetical protein ABIJ09_06860 [Pseudomonadota bacterium]